MPASRKPVGSGTSDHGASEVHLFLEPTSTLPSPYLNSYKSWEPQDENTAPIPPAHRSPSIADRYSYSSAGEEEPELTQQYSNEDAFAPHLNQWSHGDYCANSYPATYSGDQGFQYPGMTSNPQFDKGHARINSQSSINSLTIRNSGSSASQARAAALQPTVRPQIAVNTEPSSDFVQPHSYGSMDTNDSDFKELAAEFGVEDSVQRQYAYTERPALSLKSQRSYSSTFYRQSGSPQSRNANSSDVLDSPGTFGTAGSFDEQVTSAVADLKLHNENSELTRSKSIRQELQNESPAETDLGIGQRSAYVEFLYSSVGDLHSKSKPTRLPVGARAAKLTKQMAVPPELLRKAMNIRYTHLQPRMLASEIDDDDDDETPQVPLSAQPSIYPRARAPDSESSNLSDVNAIHSQSRRSSSSTESVVEDVGRVRLFVANPDSDED